MTFINCECPLPTEIGDIAAVTCGENIGQIVKIAFQRVGTQFPTFTGATALGADVLASWTTVLAASDATKVQISPFTEAVEIPNIEAVTEGGDDNSTLDGNIINVGASTVRATGTIRSLPAATLVELKAYACEGALSAYFINEFGFIVGKNAGGTTFEGIPISEWFIGDPGNLGKNTADKANFVFNLVYGWRDTMAICFPDDFNGRDLSS